MPRGACGRHASAHGRDYVGRPLADGQYRATGPVSRRIALAGWGAGCVPVRASGRSSQGKTVGRLQHTPGFRGRRDRRYREAVLPPALVYGAARRRADVTHGRSTAKHGRAPTNSGPDFMASGRLMTLVKQAGAYLSESSR